jgi:hypothetical protein
MKRSWTVRQKLFVVIVAFTIPILVLLMLYVGAIREFIDFAEKERQGLSTRGPSSGCSSSSRARAPRAPRVRGDSDAAEETSRKAGQIDAAFSQLRRSMRGSRRTRDLAGGARPEQEEPSGRRDSPACVGRGEDEGRRHGRVPSHATPHRRRAGLIVHVGDKSNLILDPDLDSYYLMDVSP